MNYKELDIICKDINVLIEEIAELFNPELYFHTNSDPNNVRVFIFEDFSFIQGIYSATVIIKYDGGNKYHIEIITSGSICGEAETLIVEEIYNFFFEKTELLQKNIL